MKFLYFLLLFVFAGAQDVNIDCNFMKTSTGYTCQISRVVITDNENFDIAIGGCHLSGMTNDDVLVVEIVNSSVPFVITQVFTTFPNVFYFTIKGDSGLSRIQTNAFKNASNLQFVFINGLSQLRSIEAYAFTGGSRILSLDLILNQIESIHKTAFDGLAALRYVYLDGNRLSKLHEELFRPCRRLEIVHAPVNFIESLDGRLLYNNTQIRILDFSKNSINAIGGKFFTGLTRLTNFRFEGNRCADGSWTISNKMTIDMVRENLTSCFENADNKPKKFVLELRGSLVIRDEDGTELVRI